MVTTPCEYGSRAAALRPAREVDRDQEPARTLQVQWIRWHDRSALGVGQPSLAAGAETGTGPNLCVCGSRPVELHPHAPIFRTRRGVPYRKISLSEDSRAIRKIVLPGDKKQLQDMRRTGAVEAQSGGADLSVISQKMANTVASCQQLQKTYPPGEHGCCRAGGRGEEARAASYAGEQVGAKS